MLSDPATQQTGVLRGGPLQARYSGLLHATLPPDLLPLAPFFADLSRLDTLANLLDRYLDTGPRGRAVRILNLGCGPMATELFCGALQGRQIVSVDYTPAFVMFGHQLQAEGLLRDVTILQGDATAMEWPSGWFDAILLHDILYENALDIQSLLPYVAQFLAPGGLLVLDVMDSRLRRFWQLMGREYGYRRYSMAEVENTLVHAGLIEITRRPSPPRAGLARQLLHSGLCLVGLSNAVAFVARRMPIGVV